MRIGMDFDNTLIDYDPLFAKVANERGWLDEGHSAVCGKNAIRQKVRAREGGEEQWQLLQAEVYGARIGEARPRAGAERFLTLAAGRGATLFIVSHKTRFASGDPARRHDLRLAASEWLCANGFFAPDGLNFPEGNLFFTDTRQEKVARIAQLRCDCFIDDLPEIFAEPGFPPTTRPILIDPWGDARPNPARNGFATWSAITRELFDDH